MGKYDAQTAWKTKNTTRVVMNLNRNTDADIIRNLEAIENKQGFLKKLLRDHFASVTSTAEVK